MHEEEATQEESEGVMARKSANVMRKFPTLHLLLDSMRRGHYYKDGRMRDGWRMVGFSMTIAEATALMREVFDEEPGCHRCGQSHEETLCGPKRRKRAS